MNSEGDSLPIVLTKPLQPSLIPADSHYHCRKITSSNPLPLLLPQTQQRQRRGRCIAHEYKNNKKPQRGDRINYLRMNQRPNQSYKMLRTLNAHVLHQSQPINQSKNHRTDTEYYRRHSKIQPARRSDLRIATLTYPQCLDSHTCPSRCKR